MKHLRRSRRQTGFSLLDVLITLVITAFGLLGLASFVTRSAAVGVDANQRARAAALLADMSNRMQNNKPNAASYVSSTVHGAAARDCGSTAAGATRDLCEWNNLLAGTNDALTSSTLTQALTFRGCVTQPTPGDPLYVVTIAWSSTLQGVAPVDTCAQGTLGDESYRRVIRARVRVANLN